jgi:hypothetical protein
MVWNQPYSNGTLPNVLARWGSLISIALRPIEYVGDPERLDILISPDEGGSSQIATQNVRRATWHKGNQE